VKQEKQKQKHDKCKTIIKYDFIIKIKQKRNKIVTKNVPKTGVE
jgi:hypothetical protein